MWRSIRGRAYRFRLLFASASSYMLRWCLCWAMANVCFPRHRYLHS